MKHALGVTLMVAAVLLIFIKYMVKVDISGWWIFGSFLLGFFLEMWDSESYP